MSQATEGNEQNTVSRRVKLASLWVSLMFLYVYADILSFYRPGVVDSMLTGKMGPLDATQGTLLFAAVLMLIPCLMFTASFIFSYKVTRVLHIVFGVLYSLVNIGNAVGEVWAYYLLYCVFELIVTVGIVVMAWRWKG